MTNFNNPEIEFTLQSVRTASKLVAQVQAELAPQAIVKGDRSPVTVADYAAQAYIGQALLEKYPEDPLIGEEDSRALRTHEQAETLAMITDYVDRYVPGADTEMVCRWIDHGSAVSGSRCGSRSGHSLRMGDRSARMARARTDDGAANSRRRSRRRAPRLRAEAVGGGRDVVGVGGGERVCEFG